MKYNNLIVVFADGTSKIFREVCNGNILDEDSTTFSFETVDGIWILNKHQIKYLYSCNDEKLSEYLQKLDSAVLGAASNPE